MDTLVLDFSVATTLLSVLADSRRLAAATFINTAAGSIGDQFPAGVETLMGSAAFPLLTGTETDDFFGLPAGLATAVVGSECGRLRGLAPVSPLNRLLNTAIRMPLPKMEAI